MRLIALLLLAVFAFTPAQAADNAAQQRQQADLDMRLHRAATEGDVDTAKKLVAAGADISSTVLVMTPLYQAASHGHAEFIRWAVQSGADIEYKNGPSQRTALHEAAYKGQVDAAKALLELGANPNAKNTHGRTPLFYAYFHESKLQQRLISLLTSHGAAAIEPPSEKLKEDVKALTDGARTVIPALLANKDAGNAARHAILESMPIDAIMNDTPEGKQWLAEHPNAGLVSDDFSLMGRIKHTLEKMPFLLIIPPLLMVLAYGVYRRRRKGEAAGGAEAVNNL